MGSFSSAVWNVTSSVVSVAARPSISGSFWSYLGKLAVLYGAVAIASAATFIAVSIAIGPPRPIVNEPVPPAKEQLRPPLDITPKHYAPAVAGDRQPPALQDRQAAVGTPELFIIQTARTDRIVKAALNGGVLLFDGRGVLGQVSETKPGQFELKPSDTHSVDYYQGLSKVPGKISFYSSVNAAGSVQLIIAYLGTANEQPSPRQVLNAIERTGLLSTYSLEVTLREAESEARLGGSPTDKKKLSSDKLTATSIDPTQTCAFRKMTFTPNRLSFQCEPPPGQ